MHVTSELPPNEMKGSGTPVTGHDDVTTPMLTKACIDDERRAADGEQEPEPVGRAQRDAHGAVGEDQEERDDDERPEQAQLFADDREDEVGVLLGQIEEFLARQPEPEPEGAAAAQRVAATARCESRC